MNQPNRYTETPTIPAQDKAERSSMALSGSKKRAAPRMRLRSCLRAP